jgi:hypothetical protein
MQFTLLVFLLYATMFGAIVCATADDNPVVFRCDADKKKPKGFCSQYHQENDKNKKGAYKS